MHLEIGREYAPTIQPFLCLHMLIIQEIRHGPLNEHGAMFQQ